MTASAPKKIDGRRRPRKKPRPVLETIAAFAEAKGARVRRRGGEAYEDMSKPACFDCGRHPAKPMAPLDVRDVRDVVKAAKLPERFAYALAKTGVLVVSGFQHCPCDKRAWTAALATFDRARYDSDRAELWDKLGDWRP